MQPLTHKYKPKNTKEVHGQDNPLKKLETFITNFSKEKKNAALIYGPSGVGKTSSVYAIADELGHEVIEVNASDFRNADQINLKVGGAVKQQSLFAKGKIILVDEVDGLSGHKDRGGIQAIVKLLQKSTYPIILTATNPFESKFSSLRGKSSMMEFKHLDYLAIFKILKRICENEKIKFEDDVLKALSRRAGGDSRAAINDLQMLTQQKKELSKDSLEELTDRNKKDKIMTALNKIFKTTDLNIAISAFNNVQEDLNQQFLWIDENLPKEYKRPEDLAKAYDMLSKADVFNRRIRRWQHYRFLVYINALITAGIASAKKEKYKQFVEYKPTGRILKLWWAKQKSMKKKAIAQKIAEKTHSSKKEILKSTMPYIPVMFRNRKMQDSIINELDLDKEEVEWIKKQAK
ncbi:AAA family ATPase [Candidatus Woesearchaeota archaeon]|jgi:replication factor C large subunit|nr:AAA family ATPase [Candidatus Woesearchaeota archaeon]|tara:strand:+ start:121 stop:1335 length:1215 start_codon:yes stop_codon:yes gene_type:complete